MQTHIEARLTRSASSRSPAPQARATSAVVPAVTAISSAWRMKKIRFPVVTAATAPAPREPTILIPTRPTREWRKLLTMAGQASSQIPSLGVAIGPGPGLMTRGASPV